MGAERPPGISHHRRIYSGYVLAETAGAPLAGHGAFGPRRFEEDRSVRDPGLSWRRVFEAWVGARQGPSRVFDGVSFELGRPTPRLQRTREL